ncbi:MAG: capsid cement protein [Reyranellaceae bacterium]
MKNYVQEGKTLTLTAPYAVLSGAGFQVGAIFAVATNAADNAAAVEGMTAGVFDLVKVGSQAWSVGDKVYWDDGNKRCTTVSTAGMLVGVAVAAVGNGAGETTGRVRLNGGAPSTAEGPQANIPALTFGTNITAATANGSLTDSSATNPTDAQFNELAKELGTKVNDILAALVAAGIIAAP